MEKVDLFEQLKTQIPLDKFFEEEGFVFSPRDSKKVNSSSKDNIDGYEYKAMKLPKASLLLVSRKPNGHYVYNNVNDSSDRGSIIDYLRSYRSMSWEEIQGFAKDRNFMLPSTNLKHTLPKENIPTRHPIQNLKTEAYKPNEYYRNERMIEDSIINNSFIHDSMNFLRFSKFIESKNKYINFFTNAFQIKDRADQVTTFNCKSDFFNKGMLLGERKNGLWYAFPSENQSTLVIGEAAIDVISYFKIYPGMSEERGLVSTEGRFSKNYALELKQKLPTLKDKKIYLTNDNDVFGFHFDLCWIQSIYDLPYSVGIKQDIESKPQLHIHSEDKTLSKIVAPFLDKEDNLPIEHFKEAVIKIKEFADIKNLYVHKSRFKDWNQQLIYQIKKKEHKQKPSFKVG